jgi:hypothetical protein
MLRGLVYSAKKMTHTHQAGGKIALGFHKVCKSCDIDILTPADWLRSHVPAA